MADTLDLGSSALRESSSLSSDTKWLNFEFSWDVPEISVPPWDIGQAVKTKALQALIRSSTLLYPTIYYIAG